MRVAVRRAAHQLFDIPPVLDDRVAIQIVGREIAAAAEPIPVSSRKAGPHAAPALTIGSCA
jgi:hypothetical protein